MKAWVNAASKGADDAPTVPHGPMIGFGLTVGHEMYMEYGYTVPFAIVRIPGKGCNDYPFYDHGIVICDNIKKVLQSTGLCVGGTMVIPRGVMLPCLSARDPIDALLKRLFGNDCTAVAGSLNSSIVDDVDRGEGLSLLLTKTTPSRTPSGCTS
jgi:hypothetical protein